MGPLLMPALILGIGKLASNRISDAAGEAARRAGDRRRATRPTWWPGCEGQNIVVEPAPADPDDGDPLADART